MAKLTVKEVETFIKSSREAIERGESNKFKKSDGNGLTLIVAKNCEPFWMLRYTLGSKRSEISLGKYELLKLKEARSKSYELLKQIDAGIDPIQVRKLNKAAPLNTITDLFLDWQKGNEKRLKNPQIPQRVFKKDILPLIGKYQVKTVGPLDIKKVIETVADSNRPTIANDVLLYLKQLFNHGMKLGVATSNPAIPFSLNDAGGMEKGRDRALSFAEVEQFFRIMREQDEAISRENYLAFALLVCLGVRKLELIQAQWKEFDLESATWSLPAERSKTSNGYTIPLAPTIVEWLKELKIRSCGSPYVFPSRRRAKNPFMGTDTLNRALSKLFGIDPGKEKQPDNVMGDIAHFTVHDLRRTCRSLLAELKVPPHIAERCLNHKLRGVEGIYDKYDYFDERKDALEQLASRLVEYINVHH
ncbi:tyrosine-type recombinase/integrase [Pseudoalteromonas fenneropenaei]|uniref:Tyrosine-type recombinase/integrase n=1 Tax=Pseudoalteromonas fenneropenaei TaxID=1737459 RepID=A0ABV7CGJ2_9GAMM